MSVHMPLVAIPTMPQQPAPQPQASAHPTLAAAPQPQTLGEQAQTATVQPVSTAMKFACNKKTEFKHNGDGDTVHFRGAILARAVQQAPAHPPVPALNPAPQPPAGQVPQNQPPQPQPQQPANPANNQAVPQPQPAVAQDVNQPAVPQNPPHFGALLQKLLRR
jgi:hypothetical protein